MCLEIEDRLSALLTSVGGEYLVGLTFYRVRWGMTRPKWDHDHCELCFGTLMADDGVDDDILHGGHATREQYRSLGPVMNAQHFQLRRLIASSSDEPR